MTKPTRILSLGAGVQSTTILRMAIHGEIEPIHHAIFADTDWEPQAVYKHLDQLEQECEQAGISFHKVQHRSLYETLTNPDTTYDPIPAYTNNGIGRRQCTREYKGAPINNKVRQLAGLQPRQRSRHHLADVIIGISYDESQRMRDPAFPWIRNQYPLVDRHITRTDCINWHTRNNYPTPPRSSCVGCPYHTDQEWATTKANPIDWQRAIDVDQQLQQRTPTKAYLHRSTQPLSTIDFDNPQHEPQQSLFTDECLGLCGN